jgi:hypothetical protein
MVTNAECPEDVPDDLEKALEDLKHAEAELTEARKLERCADEDIRKAEKEIEEAARPYVFFVGKEKFETHHRRLAGAQIKAMVPNWQAGYALEVEGHGDEPDRIIADHEVVELHKHHPLHFISVPPATFGAH